MGSIIHEPIDVNPATADWQRLLARTTFQGGGFFQLMVTNLNSSAEPLVASGSRFEVNGSFYVQHGDGEILDPDGVASEQWVFAYARPLGSALIFEWRNAIPVFDVTKNGWYHPNDRMERCVAKCYRRDDGWWGKVLLATYESMADNNFSTIPNNGGTQFFESTAAGSWELSLPLGVYII